MWLLRQRALRLCLCCAPVRLRARARTHLGHQQLPLLRLIGEDLQQLHLLVLLLHERLLLLLHLPVRPDALGVIVLEELVEFAHLLLDVLLPRGQVDLLLLAALHSRAELLLFAVELLLHLLHLLPLLQQQRRLRRRRKVLRRLSDEAGRVDHGY